MTKDQHKARRVAKQRKQAMREEREAQVDTAYMYLLRASHLARR